MISKANSSPCRLPQCLSVLQPLIIKLKNEKLFFLGNSHFEDLKHAATTYQKRHRYVNLRDWHSMAGTTTARNTASHLCHALLVGMQQPHRTTLKIIMYENLLFVYGCYTSPKVVLVSFLRALKIVDHCSKKKHPFLTQIFASCGCGDNREMKEYLQYLSLMGPQIWNDIPLSLRNSLTLSSYKHKLRDYFQSL